MMATALALPSVPASAWVDDVATALRESPATDLVGLVEVPGPGGAGRTALWPRLYGALDRRLFDLGENDALRAGKGLADSLPHLGCGLESLSSIDLLVDLTLGVDPHPRPPMPRPYATWTIRLDDAGGDGSLEQAFAHAAPCYSVSLWVCGAGEAEPRLAGLSVGHLDEVSLHRNLCRGCWRAVTLVQKRLAAVERGEPSTVGDVEISAAQPQVPPSAPGRGRSEVPSPPEAIGRLVRRRAQTMFGRVRWSIRLRRASAGLPHPADSGEEVHDLMPPPNRFYADPFLVGAEGRLHLLFEEYLAEERRGVISATTLDASGRPGEVRRVLDLPHHLSYPFVLEHEGEVFMVPESAAAGTVELYRATHLPDRWEHAGTLLRGLAAYDPTLIEHAGHFWLWVATTPRAGVDADELRLFSSPDLLGPYSPHPLNPVLGDVRCARPAGAILNLDGELLRPAQDGGAGYGTRIHWRRIERLDESEYREAEAGTLEPPTTEGFSGLHTFNRRGGWEAFDLLSRRRRPQP